MFPHLFTKEFVKSFKCDVCQFSKHHRATFSPSNNKSLEPFNLIHYDLDNDTKFVNLESSKFLKDNGVVHELMCVNTPQQNGVAERKNCHLLEVARVLLFQMSILNAYWGEVVLTATYLINSLPSHVFMCVFFVHSHNPYCRKLDPRVVKCVFIGYPSNKKGFKCYHPPSRLFVSMDVTFHETQSFFVFPPLQGESYVEVESVIESLPFPIQDVQVQVQEVTRPTLVLEQVQMFEPDVSIPDNSIEEQVQLSEPEVSISGNSIKDVSDDMPIALRKGKRSCVKYPISQFVCTDHLSVQHQSFIVVIDAIKTPTSV
ncbi:hypothetical protein CR513_36218, partial [Mucuna pruriens]